MRRRRRGEQPETDYSLGDRSTGPTVQLSGVKPGMTIPRIPNAGVSQDWTGEKVSIGSGPFASQISNLFDRLLDRRVEAARRAERDAAKAAAAAGGSTTTTTTPSTPSPTSTGGARPSVPSSTTTAGGTPPQRTYSNPAANPAYQIPISRRMTRPNLFPRRQGPAPAPVPRSRLGIPSAYVPPSVSGQPATRRTASPRPSLPTFDPEAVWPQNAQPRQAAPASAPSTPASRTAVPLLPSWVPTATEQGPKNEVLLPLIPEFTPVTPASFTYPVNPLVESLVRVGEPMERKAERGRKQRETEISPVNPPTIPGNLGATVGTSAQSAPEKKPRKPRETTTKSTKKTTESKSAPAPKPSKKKPGINPSKRTTGD